jgi:hypothetical protein
MIPRGLEKVGEVPENDHVFYQTKDGRLFMRNCVGDWFEIDGDFKHLSYEEISYDYEGAPDIKDLDLFCRAPKPRRAVRVRQYRKRR